MKITYAMLMEHLSAYPMTHSYTEEMPYFYNAVMWSNEFQGEFQKHILYIAPSEMLQALSSSSAIPEELICVGYMNYENTRRYSQKCSLIQIGTVQTAGKILSEILRIIADFYQWSDELGQAVFEGDLYKFLDIAHRMIGNPLWIVDENQCLVAYTKDDQCQSPVWQDTVKTGYISLYGTSIVEMKNVEKELSNSHKPVMVKVSPLKAPFLSTNIIINNKAVAKLNCIESNKPVTKGVQDLCVYLSQKLYVEFLRQKISKSKEKNTYVKLLKDLLEKQGINEYAVQKQLEKIGWEPKKYFMLIVIPCEKIIVSKSDINSLCYQVASVVPGSVCIVWELSVVCLINSSHSNPMTEERKQHLASFLGKYNLHAGISEVYEALYMTYREFSLAKQTLAIAINDYGEGRIHRYQDYAFLNIRNILAEKDNLENFCFKGFLQLLEYDREYGTNYTHTLYVYLSNNQHPGETASALFIHRSTLNYRIKKIESIANIDLNKSDDIFAMNLSYRLLNYNDYLHDAKE